MLGSRDTGSRGSVTVKLGAGSEKSAARVWPEPKDGRQKNSSQVGTAAKSQTPNCLTLLSFALLFSASFFFFSFPFTCFLSPQLKSPPSMPSWLPNSMNRVDTGLAQNCHCSGEVSQRATVPAPPGGQSPLLQNSGWKTTGTSLWHIWNLEAQKCPSAWQTE